MMNNFESLLTKILEFVLALGLLAIALIIVTLVVLRYAFNSSIFLFHREERSGLCRVLPLSKLQNC